MERDHDGRDELHGDRYLTEAAAQELAEAVARKMVREMRAELGLDDRTAASDLRDLRNLLDSWRHVRRGALQTFGRWLGTAILIGLAWVAGQKWGQWGHP